MSTRSLLKVAALVGGIAWAIYLAIQWNDYLSAMSQMENSAFGKMAMAMGKESIESVRNRLIAQTIGALILIGIGFAIGGEETSSGSSPAKSMKFEGTPDLSNDAYKIFLVERYEINKNDVLGGYTLNGTIHKSLDEALNTAHLLHSPPTSSASIEAIKIVARSPSEPVISEIKAEDSPNDSANVPNESGHSTRNIAFTFLALVIVSGAYFYNHNNNQIKSDPNASSAQKEFKTQQNSDKNYSTNSCETCGYGVGILVEKSGSLTKVQQTSQELLDSHLLDELPRKYRYLDKFQAGDEKWRIDIGRFETQDEADVFAKKLKNYGVDVYWTPLGD